MILTRKVWPRTMPLTGTLRSWNDDRGYGFIAPTNGGPELFVHISAFPRDGSRPTTGESLTYELGRGKDGKPQAVRVYRQALRQPSSYPASHSHRRDGSNGRRSPLAAVAGVLLLAALGAYGYTAYKEHAQRLQAAQSESTAPDQTAEAPAAAYRCDGRVHCSRMTSCAEAEYFLRNCPGTKMDGNHDGVPCEQQWCTSPFAK